MRTCFLTLGFGLLLAAILGCNDTTPNSQADRVEKEVGEAVDAVGDYTEEQKMKLIDSMNQRMEELDSQMETLKQKGNELAADAKSTWEQRKVELEAKREAMREEMAELRDASGESWQDVKHGVSSAWEELKQSFDDAAREFKDD